MGPNGAQVRPLDGRGPQTNPCQGLPLSLLFIHITVCVCVFCFWVSIFAYRKRSNWFVKAQNGENIFFLIFFEKVVDIIFSMAVGRCGFLVSLFFLDLCLV